jgi:hypothetical protein
MPRLMSARIAARSQRGAAKAARRASKASAAACRERQDLFCPRHDARYERLLIRDATPPTRVLPRSDARRLFYAAATPPLSRSPRRARDIEVMARQQASP